MTNENKKTHRGGHTEKLKHAYEQNRCYGNTARTFSV